MNIRERKRVYPREYLQRDSCPLAFGLSTLYQQWRESVYGAFLLALGKGQNSSHRSEI